jgi:hypothetical protein
MPDLLYILFLIHDIIHIIVRESGRGIKHFVQKRLL